MITCESHDACTSGTSLVLTIASLQRLKMEALISAPAECEVWSVIKYLIAQNIDRSKSIICCARSMAKHDSTVNTSPSEFGWEIFNHHPLYIARTSRPVIFIFSYNQEISVRSASAFSKLQRGRDECQGGSNPKRQASTTQGRPTNVGPTI